MKNIKSGIYKITNIKNGKFYIGSSVDINSRMRGHRSALRNNSHSNKYLQNSWNKYGEDNFEFSVLEYVDFKDRKDLFKVEQDWIYKTKCFDRDVGYNIEKVVRDDHDRYGFKVSEETKEKLRNKIVSKETCQKMREAQFKKPIVQIDLNGNVIQFWSGAREAGKKLSLNQSCIYACLEKYRRTYKGFIWVYKSEYENREVNVSDYINKQGQPIKVVQCDEEGNPIKIWDSAMSASCSLKIDSSTIIKCCKHKVSSVKKNIFIYNYEYEKHGVDIHMNEILARKQRRLKPVVQCDLAGNEVARFKSLKSAIEHTGISSISSCVRGITKTAGGFTWKYI